MERRAPRGTSLSPLSHLHISSLSVAHTPHTGSTSAMLTSHTFIYSNCLLPSLAALHHYSNCCCCLHWLVLCTITITAAASIGCCSAPYLHRYNNCCGLHWLLVALHHYNNCVAFTGCCSTAFIHFLHMLTYPVYLVRSAG